MPAKLSSITTQSLRATASCSAAYRNRSGAVFQVLIVVGALILQGELFRTSALTKRVVNSVVWEGRRGVITLYNLNNSGNRTELLFRSVDVGNADECYFKAGCYLQSTQSSHHDSPVYGQVLVRDLVVDPDD